MTHRKNRELEQENARLRAERDEWKRLTQANEALHAKRDVTEQKWIALACNHEPGDPYTTLTKERLAELLRDRLDAVRDSLDTCRRERGELESRLAAATELLRECQPWMPPTLKCPVSKKLDAFLAAQPAAPGVTDYARGFRDGHNTATNQPAAPTDLGPLTEDEARRYASAERADAGDGNVCVGCSDPYGTPDDSPGFNSAKPLKGK